MDRAITVRTYRATYTGRGEFYSGVGSGDEVWVREEVVTYTNFDSLRKANVHLSIARADRPIDQAGPWLSQYDTIANLTDIEPALGS